MMMSINKELHWTAFSILAMLLPAIDTEHQITLLVPSGALVFFETLLPARDS